MVSAPWTPTFFPAAAALACFTAAPTLIYFTSTRAICNFLPGAGSLDGLTYNQLPWQPGLLTLVR